MSEWLYGDGWRYKVLTVAVFLSIALPVAFANALLIWPIGVTYAAGGIAGTLVCLFGERRYLLPSSPAYEPPLGRERRRHG